MLLWTGTTVISFAISFLGSDWRLPHLQTQPLSHTVSVAVLCLWQTWWHFELVVGGEWAIKEEGSLGRVLGNDLELG